MQMLVKVIIIKILKCTFQVPQSNISQGILPDSPYERVVGSFPYLPLHTVLPCERHAFQSKQLPPTSFFPPSSWNIAENPLTVYTHAMAFTFKPETQIEIFLPI